MARSASDSMPRGETKAALRLVFVAISLVSGGIAASAAVAAVRASDRFHHARCPAGAFMVGTIPITGAAFALLGFFVFALCWFLASRAMAASPRVSDWWNRRAAIAGEPSLPGVGAGAAWIGGVLLLLSALTLPVALLEQTCFAGDAIYTQNLPWGGLKRHAWSEVSAVETDCRWGKGGWTDGYMLHLTNGQRFGLAELSDDKAWVRAYPRFRQALHGGDFEFDASGVSSGCPLPEVPLLLEHP